MATPQRPNLPAITGFRFVLALLIVFEHQSGSEGMLQLQTRPIQPWLTHLFQSGYAAVGFFFVLSGFVLAYGYDFSTPSSAAQRHRFFLARFARIYPVYALGLLLALPFAIQSLHHASRLHPAIKNATFALAPLLLQSWLPSAAGIWNGPGWSLSDEAFFYAAFPFIGLLLWRVRGLARPLLLALLLWVYMLLSASGLALHFTPQLLHVSATSFIDQTRWVEILNFNPFINLPEFLIGILAAKIFLELQPSKGFLRSGQGAWLYLPAIAVELLVLAHADRVPYAWLHSGLLLPAHTALIIGLGLGGGFVTKALSSRPMVLLGQSSYALYLIHGPLKSIWLVAAERWGFPTVGYGWFAAYAAVSVAASLVVFLQVEEPARKLILHYFGTHPPATHLSHARASHANQLINITMDIDEVASNS